MVDAAAALADGRGATLGRGAGQSRLPLPQGRSSRRCVPAIAAAAHVVEIELVNNRIVVSRDGAARRDRPLRRRRLSSAVLRRRRARHPPAARRKCLPGAAGRIQLRAPDVGGGFGMKNALYPEWVMLLWAARALAGRSNGSSERAEDFVSTAQGRDNVTRGRLAVDAARALSRARCRHHRQPGRLSVVGRPGQLDQCAGERDGQRLRHSRDLHGGARRVHQHRADRRLSGRRQARGELPDRAPDRRGRRRSASIAIDLRRRNMIAAFPYRTALGSDRSTAAGSPPISTTPIVAADRAGFADARGSRPQRGRLRGHRHRLLPGDRARRTPTRGRKSASRTDGRVALLLGTQSNGQGHETSLSADRRRSARPAAEAFRYVQADTAKVRAGNGHGGARSMHMGGARAVQGGRREVIAKGRAIAARLLQADGRRGRLRGGKIRRRGERSAASTCSRSRAPRPIRPTCPKACRQVWTPMSGTSRPDHVSQRLPHRRGGDRSGDRRVDDRALHRGRRFRHADQSAAHHRPGAGRASRRGSARRCSSTRSTIQQSGQLLSGSFMDYALPRADDLPALRRHAHRGADRGQSARRQGLRPGRRDRGAADHHQRRPRRAVPARRSPYRHAGDAGAHLAGDQRAARP